MHSSQDQMRQGIAMNTHCARPRDSTTLNHRGPLLRDGDIHSPDIVDLDVVSRLQARVRELEATLQQIASSKQPVTSPVLQNERTDNGVVVTPSVASTEECIENDISGPERLEIEDAATILEFLAWGRRKNPDYRDVVARKDALEHQSPGDVAAEDVWDDRSPGGTSPCAYLQILLPRRQQATRLVLWYHGSFHSISFRNHLDDFYTTVNGQINHPSVDLQWIALLFAILTGALACAPRATAQAWGFPEWEQERLSKRWFKAVTTCLHQADFTACHSIYSVEAIATLTLAAHLLGFSNTQSVLLASATRIAQSLGLHRLGSETDESSPGLVDREIGRRVWCQLCIQDWFSIPFSESYLINGSCIDTAKPRNCRDDDMRTLSDDEPSNTSYSRFFFEIAALMPRLQDEMTTANTLYTRYQRVLEYDRQLRILATRRLPYYLQNVPLEPSWPQFVPWARHSLAISSSHKIIMIHRKFLELSFTNPVFARTRRTCVAAARTIIKEQKDAIHDGGPVLWIHQAFSVTASVGSLLAAHDITDAVQIILCLDLFRRTITDPETNQHRQLVQDGLKILSRCDSNMIARRGVHLLEALLARKRARSQDALPGIRTTESASEPSRIVGLDLVGIIRSFCEQDRLQMTDRQSEPTRDWPPMDFRGANRDNGQSPSLEPLSVSLGLECAEGLEDIFSLAASYVT
ncbi:fungal specific transcription factor domain-containing protein [Aspergillus thermomutatus]|uniref:Xylanolytic transcriptional activator regulatory domain-containing protein n=1 Tax=Aspergillus thermomutatus TaxID=41047 RepID=A0A397HGH2_ASPTH|nr:uncharacterized protein CDV56_104113 [Aspergillus thermomutatus]RHZ61989.1 hypothetical protein CDV56_104113 [Aspergillus thermomutatus]